MQFFKEFIPFTYLFFGGEDLILFIYLNLFIFNWRIIALQYCIGFYQASAWVSHNLPGCLVVFWVLKSLIEGLFSLLFFLY